MLALENLLLRQQLIVLQCKHKIPIPNLRSGLDRLDLENLSAMEKSPTDLQARNCDPLAQTRI